MKQHEQTRENPDQVGGNWPNETDTKQDHQPTGRTGPIDDVKRDEYDNPGENAAINEPTPPFGKSGK